jgi:CTP synthase (UTP-ammonia lyase)
MFFPSACHLIMSTGMKPKSIALIGERDLAKSAHAGIEASLALYERQTGRPVSFHWIPTTALTSDRTPDLLGDATGVWCVPGSPYADTAGALRAIGYARQRPCAFLGTCGGFQHALMEYCGAVLGRKAVHQELDDGAGDTLIMKLSCSLAGTQAHVLAPPGSWYERVVGAADSVEEFNCNYGLSPAFEPYFLGSGLEFVARDEAGQVRAFRLRDHPFFVGTLFQPERRALRGALHPLVRAFIEHT